MELPALLPKELTYTSIANTDQTLLNMLVKIPQDLVTFFTSACNDETWSEKHSAFMQGAMQWMTHQFYRDAFLLDFAKQVAASIHAHYSVLSPYIPKNLTIFLEGERIPVNSMLWGASSDFLRQKIREECRDQRTKDLELEHIERDVFHLINTFITTGAVKGLWRKSQKEVLAVIDQAAEWELTSLVSLCESILARYINPETVKNTLVMAHKKGWLHLREKSRQYLNHMDMGVHFGATDADHLLIEFFDFRENAQKIFDDFRPLITHLTVGKGLTNEPAFGDILTRCPHLVCLCISETFFFSDQLYKIPSSLEELDVSKCSWLSREYLHQLHEICPRLTALNLSDNQQINYSGWAVLREWKILEKLDISRCFQINDDDFKVILRACPDLTYLSIEECTGLYDPSFYELGQCLPRMISLNLSRSNVSDAALVDLMTHCRRLSHLDLSRCSYLTDSGMIQAIRNAASLHTLNIAKCALSQDAVTQIKKLRPFLTVIW